MFFFFISQFLLTLKSIHYTTTKRFPPFNRVINSELKKNMEQEQSVRRRLKTRAVDHSAIHLRGSERKESKGYISRFVFESLSFHFPLVLAIHLETHGDRRWRDEKKKKINPLWNRGGAMADVPEAAGGSVTGHWAGEWRVEKKKVTGRGRKESLEALEAGGSYVLLGHHVRRGTKVYPEGLWRWPKGEEGIYLSLSLFFRLLFPRANCPLSVAMGLSAYDIDQWYRVVKVFRSNDLSEGEKHIVYVGSKTSVNL